jgi:serine/threonine protein kinase
LPESIGRYVLLRELARGSTATVYLARDPVAEREVAVKVFTHAPGDPGLTRGTHRASFLNEAALVGRLHHPHIVALLDAGVEADYSYVVMEYVPGGALARHASTDNLLPLARVLESAFKISRALDYALQHGVLHRDIKPANVLLAEPFDVKLTDFGVARIATATHTEITGVGSPAYMSPEQLADQPLDHRTDIYSLGVLTYQLLTGRLPFHAPSVGELMRLIADQEAPRLRTLRPELPEVIEATVQRAMQKDAYLRYQSWAEFSTDLAISLASSR